MLERIVKRSLKESLDNLPPCKRGQQHKLTGKTEPGKMSIEFTCSKCGFTRKLTISKIEDSKGA